MPYIKQDRRKVLNDSVSKMVLSIRTNTSESPFTKEEITNEEFLSICGDINYCFSRVVSKLMQNPSYSKIAIITGVLENIKQEFYRRVAEPYEDLKIEENEDILEYYEINSSIRAKPN
jgi:hypothetical protein